MALRFNATFYDTDWFPLEQRKKRGDTEATLLLPSDLTFASARTPGGTVCAGEFQPAHFFFRNFSGIGAKSPRVAFLCSQLHI